MPDDQRTSLENILVQALAFHLNSPLDEVGEHWGDRIQQMAEWG